MPINVELEPAIINKQSLLVNTESITDMKISKEISLETTPSTNINGVEISLESIQGSAKE